MNRLMIPLATLALTVLPTLVSAEGCNWQKLKQSASQCAEGQVFDTKTGSCIAQTTS